MSRCRSHAIAEHKRGSRLLREHCFESLLDGTRTSKGKSGNDGSAGKNLYVTNPSGAVVDLNPLTGQVKYMLSDQAVNVLAVDASRLYATCGSQACIGGG